MSRIDDSSVSRSLAQSLPQPAGDATRRSSGVRAKVARSNIDPQPAGPLVGRRGELDAILQLIQRERHVTLLGAAGIGKTRVARETALRALPALEGGAWMVPLGAATSVEGIACAVAGALDVRIPADGGEDLLSQVGAMLAARGKILVVLDGTEHVAEAASRALETWKRVARETRWLVTSRSRLTTPGEVLFELGPLGLHPYAADADVQLRASDAVRLFAQRSPIDVLTASEVGVLAQLVRSLDGNALAIELVASCTQSAPPRNLLVDVLREIERRTSPGGPARRTPAHPRQVALRAAIDVAWSKLATWARSAAAELSVFAGAFDEEAAEHVLTAKLPEPLRIGDALEELRLRRIITGVIDDDGALRYTMHSALRDAANERLVEGGGRTAAEERHARYFLFLRRARATWNDFEELLAIHRRGSGEETIEAAMAIDPLLSLRGPAALRLALVDEALGAAGLAAGDQAAKARRARALAVRADAHRVLGHEAAAVADGVLAEELSRDLRDRATHGRVLHCLGVIAYERGELGLARARLEEALADFVATTETALAGLAVAALARVHRAEGRLELAEGSLEQAMTMHRAARDRAAEGATARALAEIANDRGDRTAARALCDRALTVFAELGDEDAQADVEGVLARVAHEDGQSDAAQELLLRAARTHAAHGNRRGEGALLSRAAAISREKGDLEEARLAFARALVLLRECKDRADEGLALSGLAVLEAMEGGVESAKAALHRASEAALARADDRIVVELARGHIELALAHEAARMGDDARAQSYADSARRRIEATAAERARSADVRASVTSLGAALSAFERGEARFAGAPRGGRMERRRASSSIPAPLLDRDDYPEEALLVCARGRWFRSPRGANVPIDRWQALQNLVVRLAERREIAPGETLTVEDLISAGWPGERVLPKAGATRVYTALSTLRRLGMREVLVRRDGGYMFDPDVPLLRVSTR